MFFSLAKAAIPGLSWLRLAGLATVVLTLAGLWWHGHQRGAAGEQLACQASAARAEAQERTRQDAHRKALADADATLASDRAAFARTYRILEGQLNEATRPLQSCRVPDDAVRLLNDLARNAGAN